MGIDLNKQDKNGWTLLHFTSCDGYKEIVKLLLDYGVDVNIINRAGNRPLDLAIIYGHKETPNYY